jgi:hypothetical protein
MTIDFDEVIARPIGEHAVTGKRRHLGVIGASGSGKTTWAVQVPDVLVLVAEKQAIGRIQETNPKAFVIEIDSVTRIREVYMWLVKTVFPGGEPRKKGFVPQFIVLDSVTEMCRFVADGMGDDKDWTYRDWKRYEQGCLKLLRKFRDLPTTLIATFLDEIHEGTENSLGTRRMDVGKKKMSAKVAALFDCVFWMETRSGSGEEGRMKHFLRTEGGSFQGFKLEQGKGHEALEKWLDAGEFTPEKVLNTITSHTINKMSKEN